MTMAADGEMDQCDIMRVGGCWRHDVIFDRGGERHPNPSAPRAFNNHNHPLKTIALFPRSRSLTLFKLIVGCGFVENLDSYKGVLVGSFPSVALYSIGHHPMRKYG